MNIREKKFSCKTRKLLSWSKTAAAIIPVVLALSMLSWGHAILRVLELQEHPPSNPDVPKVESPKCESFMSSPADWKSAGLDDLLIVDFSLAHAFAMAKCAQVLLHPSSITILQIVEWDSTSHNIEEQELVNDHDFGDSLRIWKAREGDLSKEDLELLRTTKMDSLVFNDKEVSEILGDKRISSVFVNCPCEVDGRLPERTFSIKLHAFLHAWQLASRRGKADSRSAPSKIKWVIKECQDPSRASTLLHTGTIFRPRELVNRVGAKLFYFETQTSTLAQRYETFYSQITSQITSKTGRPFLTFDHIRDTLEPEPCNGETCRLAYMTVIHPRDEYLCGALVMGHTIRRFDKTNDMVALVTSQVSKQGRAQLARAGWIVINTERIRGPSVKGREYLDYSFTKLRMFSEGYKLGYDKVAVIDCDMLFLQDPSILLKGPTFLAFGHYEEPPFEASLMVFEPSQWLFDYFMEILEPMGPYFQGEQSFLQKTFGLQFRLDPGKKLSKYNDTQLSLDDETFLLHYYGSKPWDCPSRKQDCCEDRWWHKSYTNNAFYHYWFKVHDEMSESCANADKPISLFECLSSSERMWWCIRESVVTMVKMKEKFWST